MAVAADEGSVLIACEGIIRGAVVGVSCKAWFGTERKGLCGLSHLHGQQTPHFPTVRGYSGLD